MPVPRGPREAVGPLPAVPWLPGVSGVLAALLAPLSVSRMSQEDVKPRLAPAVFKVIVIHMDWAVVIS